MVVSTSVNPRSGAPPSPSRLVGRERTLRRPRNPLMLASWLTVRNPMGAFGLTVLGLLVITAAFAPVIAPYNPAAQHRGQELALPGAVFPLGADEFGRDILSRIIWGSRVSLLVGVVAIALGAGVGVSSGLLAGYVGGWLDAVIMRFYDAVLAFPPVLLGIAVVAVLGPGSLHVALALAIAQMPVFALITRSSVLMQRDRDYVQAAHCLGAGPSRIMWRHVLPNSLSPILVQVSLAMGFAVMAEAALSFLGLGTQPPDPSWGQMLNDSRAYLRQAPWYGVWPGVALAIVLIALNYLSDARRDAVDPRRISS